MYRVIRIAIVLTFFPSALINDALGGQSHAKLGEENSDVSTPAISDQDLELYEAAVRRMLASDYNGWTFRQVADDGDDVMVEIYDSSRPEAEQWTLISKNGSAPSAGDIRKYKKNKEEKRKNNAESEIDESNNDFLRVLVRPGTLRVTDRTERSVTYAFRPQFSKQEEKVMEDHVFGALTVTKENPRVEQVHLFNLEEFEMGSAKIREFQQKISFSPAGQSNEAPVFFKNVKITVKGKAFGLFGIDKKVNVDFSEYRKID